MDPETFRRITAVIKHCGDLGRQLRASAGSNDDPAQEVVPDSCSRLYWRIQQDLKALLGLPDLPSPVPQFLRTVQRILEYAEALPVDEAAGYLKAQGLNYLEEVIAESETSEGADWDSRSADHANFARTLAEPLHRRLENWTDGAQGVLRMEQEREPLSRRRARIEEIQPHWTVAQWLAIWLREVLGKLPDGQWETWKTATNGIAQIVARTVTVTDLASLYDALKQPMQRLRDALDGIKPPPSPRPEPEDLALREKIRAARNAANTHHEKLAAAFEVLAAEESHFPKLCLLFAWSAVVAGNEAVPYLPYSQTHVTVPLETWPPTDPVHRAMLVPSNDCLDRLLQHVFRDRRSERQFVSGPLRHHESIGVSLFFTRRDDIYPGYRVRIFRELAAEAALLTGLPTSDFDSDEPGCFAWLWRLCEEWCRAGTVVDEYEPDWPKVESEREQRQTRRLKVHGVQDVFQTSAEMMRLLEAAVVREQLTKGSAGGPAIAPTSTEGTDGDAGAAMSEQAQVATGEQNSPGSTKKKRSTDKGEALEKLISFLSKHHRYADVGGLNQEPIGNNELARLAGVDKATASAFFKQNFQGHRQYQRQCADDRKLLVALKLLNGDMRPSVLNRAKPLDDGGRGEE